MVVHSRIICLPSVWKEILVRYIKFKNDLGSDLQREYNTEIYWKDDRFVIFEESFTTVSTIELINGRFITFCDTLGTPNILKSDKSFEGNIYSSIPDMVNGNSKAFINFYGEEQ